MLLNFISEKTDFDSVAFPICIKLTFFIFDFGVSMPMLLESLECNKCKVVHRMSTELIVKKEMHFLFVIARFVHYDGSLSEVPSWILWHYLRMAKRATKHKI